MTIVGWKEFLKLADAPEIPEDVGKFDRSITQLQKEMLHKRGIGYDGLNYQKANIVLCVANYRFKKGLATPGQMKILAKLGFENIGKITLKDAKYIIGMSYHW